MDWRWAAVLAAAAAAGIAAGGGARMTTWHVDAAGGNDANDGKSPAAAWKTVGRVNRGPFSAGDRLVFAGGQVHAGTVTLKKGDGAPDRLMVSSYGDGRATIDGGTGDGLVADGLAGLTVERLIVVGAGRLTGSKQGQGVALVKVRDAVVNEVEASGFQKAGIVAWDCENVRITRCYAHDNGFVGIWMWGTAKSYVGHCRAINNPGDPTIRDNHSGNGILLGGCTDSTVERCEAAGNGWDQPKGGQGNGPVGIWCHDSERVTIQYCISHHNKSTSGDGGGFDFDGGTRDSVLQYNYSYENHSSGYLIWEYGSKYPLKNNTIRYNLSVNDREGGIRMGMSGGQEVTGLFIHHNTIINANWPCVNLQGGLVDGKWDPDGGVRDVFVRNNILIGPKGGEILKVSSRLRFEGNLYWSHDGSFKVGGHASLEEWAKATGQETIKGKVVGVFADPKLNDGLLIPQLVDPDRLGDLAAFMLTAGSPAVDRGLDLKGLFGLDSGGKDFFGKPAPRGAAPDIGAHELR